MLFKKYELADNITSKKNKFLKNYDTVVEVTDSYPLFGYEYRKYLSDPLNLEVRDEDVIIYIFLETLMLMSKNNLWTMETEQIIDIMDFALGTTLDTDKYFDFRDLTVKSPNLNELVSSIVNKYNKYDIVDYIVTNDNKLYLVLNSKSLIKPKVKFIFKMPAELDMFFTIYHVSTKRAETLFFISKLIDISLEAVKDNGDNEEPLSKSIEDLLLVNKLYSDIDPYTTNELDFNPIHVYEKDHKLLEKSVRVFTDSIIKENLTFKALDIVIEDVVNKNIIGYIRGDI